MPAARSLASLRSVGRATLDDFRVLGVSSLEELAKCDPQNLYDRLCVITKTRQDPCVLDVFHCAVAQARNPRLPAAQKDWWWWSRRRKEGSR